MNKYLQELIDKADHDIYCDRRIYSVLVELAERAYELGKKSVYTEEVNERF